jgi:hypothetical protein
MESIEGLVYAPLSGLHPAPQYLISLLAEHAHSMIDPTAGCSDVGLTAPLY